MTQRTVGYSVQKEYIIKNKTNKNYVFQAIF